jgi:hypothetical protein
MRYPDFSEFTFGYAFTDNLLHSVLTEIAGVPIFPSLVREGSVGYDVKIPHHSRPLFLQFKLPQLVRRHRKEWDHDLNPPYYRMHLMRRSHSTQHAALFEHAKQGNLVFYVAPEFEGRAELDELYQNGDVPRRSVYFDPKDIGELFDNAPHHVAYKTQHRPAWLCSRPRQLQRDHRADYFLSQIRGDAQSAPEVEETPKFFEEIALSVVRSAIYSERKQMGTPTLPPADPVEIEWRRLSPFKERLAPAQFAAFVSQLYLDSYLMILGRDK